MCAYLLPMWNRAGFATAGSCTSPRQCILLHPSLEAVRMGGLERSLPALPDMPHDVSWIRRERHDVSVARLRLIPGREGHLLVHLRHSSSSRCSVAPSFHSVLAPPIPDSTPCFGANPPLPSKHSGDPLSTSIDVQPGDLSDPLPEPDSPPHTFALVGLESMVFLAPATSKLSPPHSA